MNKKLLNTQIKALTESHGADIVAFYKSQGFDVRYLRGDVYEKSGSYLVYYGVDQEGYFNNRVKANNGIKTITLEEAKGLVKGDEYPKVMLVSDSKDFLPAYKRVVFMKKRGKYLAWSDAETIKESEKKLFVYVWNFAKDIEEESEKNEKLNELIDQARVYKLEVNRLTKKSDKVDNKLKKAMQLKYSIKKQIKQLKNK